MKNLRILLAHNRYKFRGGEDVVFEQESELLEHNSYSVHKYIVDNSEELDNLWNKFKLIFNTHYSGRSYRKVARRLEEVSPDLVHVHNFFPLITPSVFDACRTHDIPTVLTLHNYRLLYPNGLLLHDGKIDERSIEGSAYQCIKDKVYRDSYFQTAVVAHMIEHHRSKGTWKEKVDCFIALTDFAKEKFVAGGLPRNKIMVKPNFVDDPVKKYGHDLDVEKEPYFIFVGRISKEKDLETILKAWEIMDTSYTLKIVGTGPLESHLQKKTAGNDNIKWLGEVPRKQIYEWVKYAQGLIFSSKCYESFPLTILEAFSVGTPVISSNIGSQAEIVDDQKTGFHYNVGDEEDLARVIDVMLSSKNRRELSENARREYELKYTPEINFERLQQIYQQALTS